MKRLLAKLPRSSSGSRDASANSSASRLPFDIFDVSMTAHVSFSGLALVSSAICFSGASSGDFIRRIIFQIVSAGELLACRHDPTGWKPVARDRQDPYPPSAYQLS